VNRARFIGGWFGRVTPPWRRLRVGLADLALLRLDPFPLVHRRTPPPTLVALRMPDPALQRSAVQPIFTAIELIAARCEVCPPQARIPSELRAREPQVRIWVNLGDACFVMMTPIFLRNGASNKSGAVQGWLGRACIPLSALSASAHNDRNRSRWASAARRADCSAVRASLACRAASA